MRGQAKGILFAERGLPFGPEQVLTDPGSVDGSWFNNPGDVTNEAIPGSAVGTRVITNAADNYGSRQYIGVTPQAVGLYRCKFDVKTVSPNTQFNVQLYAETGASVPTINNGLYYTNMTLDLNSQTLGNPFTNVNIQLETNGHYIINADVLVDDILSFWSLGAGPRNITAGSRVDLFSASFRKIG